MSGAVKRHGKRYVMIGAPVTSVRTPPMLEAFLEGRGVAASVEVRHVDPDGLADFMGAVRRDPAIDGLLVTMPHKRAIIGHLDGLTAVAKRAGSVNAVKRIGRDRLLGAQFDGIALVHALMAAGAPVAEARILLAGAGGAGLPIAQAFVRHGCVRLAIRECDDARLRATLQDLAADANCPVAAFGFEEDSDGFDLLVNATPLGMNDADPSPFSDAEIASAAWIADIVADPPRTRLAAAAGRFGKLLVTGRDMVAGQVAPIGRWLMSDEGEQ